MAPRQAASRGGEPHHVGNYVIPALDKKIVKEEDISFLGDHHADKPLLQRLNYLHVFILFGVPALALYGLATWTFNWYTVAFAVAYYWWSGLGITAGACPASRSCLASAKRELALPCEWPCPAVRKLRRGQRETLSCVSTLSCHGCRS